jgi:hypothetical protein
MRRIALNSLWIKDGEVQGVKTGRDRGGDFKNTGKLSG